MTTRVIDHGWNNIVKEMKAMKNSYVKVGFPNGSKKEKNGASVLDVAMVHEFGLPSKNIPSRPFMSLSFDSNIEEINRVAAQLKSDIFSGTTTTREALSVMGSWFKGKIQDIFITGNFKPLAPSTLAARLNRGVRKRASNTLNRLRGKSEVSEKQYQSALKARETLSKSATPLIDTGRMRQSVQYEVHSK